MCVCVHLRDMGACWTCVLNVGMKEFRGFFLFAYLVDQVSSFFFNNPCNIVEMRWGKKLKTNVTIMTKSSVNFYHFFF